MTDYARPGPLDEALELLARDGAAPLAGGTDLAGQIDRGIRAPALLVDLQALGLGGIADARTAARRSARRRRSPTLPRRDLRGAVRGVATAAGAGGLGAPAQRRHRRRQPLPAHALLVLPRRRVALLARRRRHVLRADRRPPQAQPRAGRLHLRAPVRSRAGARGVRRDGRRRGRRTGSVSCRCSSSTGGRPTTTGRCSRSLTASSSPRCGSPLPPDASAYLRAGERQAFSFPLVSVAAARRGDATSGSSPPGWPTSRASSTRPTRSPGCRATRRARGSGRCSRRSSSGRVARVVLAVQLVTARTVARCSNRNATRVVWMRSSAFSIAGTDCQSSNVVATSSWSCSVSSRWPLERSSHALSARPSSPSVSGWRVQNSVAAIERYWWIRAKVIGCSYDSRPTGEDSDGGRSPCSDQTPRSRRAALASASRRSRLRARSGSP